MRLRISLCSVLGRSLRRLENADVRWGSGMPPEEVKATTEIEEADSPIRPDHFIRKHGVRYVRFPCPPESFARVNESTLPVQTAIDHTLTRGHGDRLDRGIRQKPRALDIWSGIGIGSACAHGTPTGEVVPYFFDFKFFAKKRMQGKQVLDVFCEEFPAMPRSYYEAAAADGRLRVECGKGGKGTAVDRIVQGSPLLGEQRFVLGLEAQVLGMTEEVVAVDKPAGVPVHVAGQYRKNTVLGILEAERPDLWKLLPVHRLDKPVSGVLLLARSAAVSNALREKLQERSMRKTYLARVVGVFPPGEQTVDAALAWDARTNTATVAPGGGQGGGSSWTNGAAAKAAQTVFRRVSVARDGCTSLVECKPLTGRTHQIRVHLQYLGHPIANDRQYGGTLGPSSRSRPLPPPSPTAASQDTSASHAHAAASSHHHARQTPAEAGAISRDTACPDTPAAADAANLPPHERAWVPVPDRAELGEEPLSKRARVDTVCAADREPPLAASEHEAEVEVVLDEKAPASFQSDRCCHCPYLAPRNYPLALEAMWLHAARYTCEDWSFEAPLPPWAQDPHPALMREDHAAGGEA